jgi:hypothetical protein
VLRIVYEIQASKEGYNIRVIGLLLSYAEYQFGAEVKRKSYREREDGERMSNFDIDLRYLYRIHIGIIAACHQENSLNHVNRKAKIIGYLERSLRLLNPWLIHLESDASNRIDSLNDGQIETLLKTLCHIELNMADVAMKGMQFGVAEGHCQRVLAYSRRLPVEGDTKTTMIFQALSGYCVLRERQGDYTGAVKVAEECYSFVVEAYDPVHFQVQEAAGILINILIKKGDLYDAERYAQITYSTLRDKKNGIHRECEEVLQGALNLAEVIYRQNGDSMKAEELARESLRIRKKVHGCDHHSIGAACSLIGRILVERCKIDHGLLSETRGFFERALAIFIRHEGPDGLNTANISMNIGNFYSELVVKLRI